MNFFVVDIGGTNLRICIVNIEGEILRKEKLNTPKDFLEICNIIEKSYKDFKKLYSLEERIGISVAGGVFEENFVWLPNVSSERFPLKSYLEKNLKISVKILDDRISGSLGEYWKGKGKDKKILLYLIIGTGVGLGILIDGKPIYGKNWVSGSLGWLPLGKRNSLSSKIGTLESQISGPSILREYNSISQRKLEKAEEVFKAFEKKDKNAEKVISKAGKLLGKTLSSLANIFDPDIIILSGSIGLRWDIFKPYAYPIMNLYLSPIIKENLEIAKSELGEDAQILGLLYNMF